MATAHYDDPSYSYEKYWNGRDYEQKSEVIALKKLLGKSRFSTGADIGGGFGRLTSFLTNYCNQVHLIEPSEKQLQIAHRYLKDFPNVTIKQGLSQNIDLPDNSLDLAIMVRVSHHLPDLKPTLDELSRILQPKGLLVLEFANSYNFKSRLRSIFNRQPITTVPVEKRSPSNIKKNTIPFVNHHPKSVLQQLKSSHFTPVKVLSVSNLRSQFLKRTLPSEIILVLESVGQNILAPFYFGPSIFVLARNNKVV